MVDWEVVLVVGEKGILWETLLGHPTGVSSFDLIDHDSHPMLLSMGTRDWERSLQTGSGVQRVIGDNNKRGCCTGRHAAWPMKGRIQILWNYSLGVRDRNRKKRPAPGRYVGIRGINVELRKVRESTTR